MAEQRHGFQADSIHVPYRWSYADATARGAATGFVATDLGKFARQLDDNSIWMLTAITPTWAAVTTPNLTGPITSVGSVTAVASQTGTGSKFVMDTSPTLITPILGVAAATSIAVPVMTTAVGAITITPAAGSGLNVVLSTTGDFAVTTNQLYVDTSTGNVGIGTTSPSSKFQIVTESASDDRITEIQYSSSGAPGLELKRAIGTLAAPLAIDGEKALGANGFWGHNGSAFIKVAQLDVRADNVFSVGNTPAHMRFLTMAGSGGTLTERVRITSGGNVGIGMTVPVAKTHIAQASTTAAIPVLLLNQADLDQPMIELVTTIGTGNAIEAVAAKTLTTTHFIMVKIPGGLVRYLPIGTIA